MKHAFLFGTIALPLFAAAANSASLALGPWEIAPAVAKYVKVVGDRVIVDVPVGVSNVCAYATAHVDLSQFSKGALEARIACCSTNVVLRPARGVRFALHYDDPVSGKRLCPSARAPKSESFGWTELEIGVSLGEYPQAKSKNAVLVLGLQETSGRIEFDLSKFVYRKAPPFFPVCDNDRKVHYPDRVGKLPRMRGVMGLGLCRNTEKDIEDLKNYGANLVRLQMNGFRAKGDPGKGVRPKTLADWDAWLAKNLDHAEEVLGWLEKRGMMMVLDMHNPPLIGFGPDIDVFYVKANADRFVSSWREIAQRFKGRKGIYGYDLINEPMQTRRALADCDYWNLQRRAAEAIREVDPEATIIFECNEWSDPSGYPYLRTLDMDNVIYEVHMYLPMEFTHQGANGSSKPSPEKIRTYPDMTRGWDKAYLRRQLTAVREFQLRHDAKIFVGEFSACIYGEGVGNYLSDCIDIFEEYGWDWTYHSFREALWWNVETVIDGQTGEPVPNFDNPRFHALVDGFRRKR